MQKGKLLCGNDIGFAGRIKSIGVFCMYAAIPPKMSVLVSIRKRHAYNLFMFYPERYLMHNLIFYDCNLKGKKRKVFLEFIKKYSNVFSIESYFNGKLTNTEMKDIQNELSDYFKHEDQECRKRYKMDADYRHTLKSGLNIKTKAQAERYFDKIYKENMAEVEMCDFKAATDHIDYLPFIEQGYLGNRVTRIGTNSLGGIYNILYYDICMLDVVTQKIDDLCDYIDIGKEQFWDLAFYHDKELIFSIYTDDKEAYGYFNDDIYRDFKRLNIPFSFEEEWI